MYLQHYQRDKDQADDGIALALQEITRAVTATRIFVRDAARGFSPAEGRFVMLSYAITFLVLAIIAGLLGASGVAAMATNFAYILFVIALVLFLINLVSGRRTLAP